MSTDTIPHRIVRPMVRLLARTRVTPDHLTGLRLATAVACAAAFAQGGDFWVNVGAGIFVVSALLDRADGELARQTRRFSQYGHHFDLLSDCAAGVMAFVGLGIGAAGGPLGSMAIVLGLSAGIGVATLFWQINVQDLGTLPQYVAGNGRVLVDPDDVMFVVPVLLWCFGAEPVVVATGTVPPLIALWKALAHRRRGASAVLPQQSDSTTS